MKRPGFTLVEMMVALFIFGILSAAGVSVMSYAASNQTVVREHTEALGAFQRLRATLKADLSQTVNRRTRGVDGVVAPGPFAGGGPSSGGPLLSLVRSGWENPDGAPRASLQYVEYRVVDERLERATRPALDGAPLSAPQVLHEGVTAADVRFYSRGQWLEVWQPSLSNALPDAVRMDLTLEGVGPVTQLFLVAGGAA